MLRNLDHFSFARETHFVDSLDDGTAFYTVDSDSEGRVTLDTRINAATDLLGTRNRLFEKVDCILLCEDVFSF